ncbi:hypothetical protein GE21DRAFT_9049 [Neurospora crassa]|uniref:Uncharacterized protein n=3 Tax=Neurospora TaxID=5140 RepID=Q7S5W3_NEUCR|nr:hypothetical protein NCU09872 [Neurospora crassa OR74A]EAA30918.1 hypothetical protein NCU09872 [Neurospora crassa OR74A]KAK3492577.1 hypothetical protein B0T23DRAFT_145218 [Neurospora hispaniola]KAK3503737.1 hypothetical protein B0T13DRAFT_458346 [Neurospora crassa]KHE81382.1 hypothetical protein GE21DRAFT_9049 [Neurospora crassa]|eukprot:XP_960154.1 hypothetical protein NCU09872 [Neurospora crassa OR74A]
MTTPILTPTPIYRVCALIELKGSANIRDWNHFLRVELDAEELTEYVFGPTSAVPEPNKNLDPVAHKAWKLARAKAMRILYTTLKRETVTNRLEGYGWDEDNRDPSYVHKLVWKVFGPGAPSISLGGL